MATEFERKYLVNGSAWSSQVKQVLEIAQGYLSTADRANVRVRISEPDAWLTIKGARDGIGRPEFEYLIPLEDARVMLKSLSVSLVVKTRHILDASPGHWTIDVFHGDNDGLVLLEIESSEDFTIDSLPTWVGQEVSDDYRFTNAHLSEHPYVSWRE
jgi:adenylate cyclase